MMWIPFSFLFLFSIRFWNWFSRLPPFYCWPSSRKISFIFRIFFIILMQEYRLRKHSRLRNFFKSLRKPRMPFLLWRHSFQPIEFMNIMFELLESPILLILSVAVLPNRFLWLFLDISSSQDISFTFSCFWSPLHLLKCCPTRLFSIHLESSQLRALTLMH